mmetsp:Transcript_9784/g.16144  ORF Transcript_9784/g.16144 Transcript_9784/m.16144 type:complete len:307 (-) Transcript_9784:146-1066(-)|eukprot:CAMPEP_0174975170 /NCGR_PEP_ID=MMETSP0004_2-20121128/12285_1 /TAXON_ID=420556 /ORGANISM="Ochromonas sp., Strain CCMP1393" /LENGTH=306 /DNA_ID=CAMNT_0016225973 /DNA_START=145 /DNA_END=1065 /DNA_ORIENTATION=-
MEGDFAEEVEALSSIYESSITIERLTSDGGVCNVVSYVDPDHNATITFTVPQNYPVESSPTFQLSFKSRTESDKKLNILQEIEELIVGGKGGVILFSCIEKFKELLVSAAEGESGMNTGANNEDTFERLEMSTVFSAASAGVTKETPPIEIVHGPITTENRSSFQSHIAAVQCMEDVRMFKSIVLSDKKVARATHNIFAYRFVCPNGTGVVYHDCDDDGETAAAGRVAEMMRLMHADGVAVIVTRWFGGVLLGPDRFKFICNSARLLLEENGYSKSLDTKASSASSSNIAKSKLENSLKKNSNKYR